MIDKREWVTTLAAAGALLCASATALASEPTSPMDEQAAQEQTQQPAQEQQTRMGGQAGQASEELDRLAQEHQDLETFIQAVNEAGMADALFEGQSYTIFAPTNEAFESADRSVEELLQPENREELIALLRAHIVADDVDPQMAEQIGEAMTIDGGSVELQGSGEDLQVADARVVETDIQQGNLRIYAIDQVLSPSPGTVATADDMQQQTGGTQQMASFEELDQDGDGYLSEEELQAAEQDLQPSELDTDNDGRVSRTEFAAFEAGEQPQEDTGEMQTDQERENGGFFSDEDGESDF